MTDRFVVATRTDHPVMRRSAARKPSLTLDDFVAHKHVQTQSTSLRDGHLDGALEQLGLRREIAIATKDYRSALDMLPGSDLLLAIPERIVRKLSPKGIAIRPLPFETREITYDLVWDSRFEQQDGIQWLLQTITALCGSLPF